MSVGDLSSAFGALVSTKMAIAEHYQFITLVSRLSRFWRSLATVKFNRHVLLPLNVNSIASNSDSTL